MPLPSGPFDALLATSRHAFTQGPDLQRWGKRLPVFAVGRRTAEAARAAGFDDVRIGAGDGEGLATLVRLTLPRPARLLYLAGRDRKPTLEALARRRGRRARGRRDLRGRAGRPLARDRGGDAARRSDRCRPALLAPECRTRLGDEQNAWASATRSCSCITPACRPTSQTRCWRRRPSRWRVAARPDEDSLLALLSDPSWARSTGRR